MRTLRTRILVATALGLIASATAPALAVLKPQPLGRRRVLVTILQRLTCWRRRRALPRLAGRSDIVVAGMKLRPDANETTSLADRLAHFREAHPVRRLELGGVEWCYRVVGAGDPGLVLLPGSAGGGDAYFLLAERLAERLRCVLIDYPVVADLEALLAGIDAVLAREQVERISIMGGSFGGMVAQALLLTRSDRVERVVLNSTGPPSPARARSNRRWQPVLRLIPMPCIRALLRLVVRKIINRVDVEPEFWLQYYTQAADAVTRADLEAKYRVSIEFDRDFGDRLAALEAWDGEILITEGSADTVAGERARQELLRAYPKARVETFAGAGHGVSLERPDEWKMVVASFLLADEASAKAP